MKKLIMLSFLFCSLSIPVFADNTDYKNTNQCQTAVEKYKDAAIAHNQNELADWFFSFMMQSDGKISCTGQHCKAFLSYGCTALNDNDYSQKVWPKMRSQLNEQIDQLKANQSSVHGSKVLLVCDADANSNINFDSCK